MDVISPSEDMELVRRLTTGVIANWNELRQGDRDAIIREATLAHDPTSKRTSLEQDIRAFIRKHEASQ
jgi:hypothetical protein